MEDVTESTIHHFVAGSVRSLALFLYSRLTAGLMQISSVTTKSAVGGEGPEFHVFWMKMAVRPVNTSVVRY